MHRSNCCPQNERQKIVFLSKRENKHDDTSENEERKQRKLDEMQTKQKFENQQNYTV